MIAERAALVRARIAAHVLAVGDGCLTLGDITLHAHQRSAVDRLRELLERERGALLADEAGLGKTYVAAAVMRDAERALLVVPASLRIMWRDALRSAGVSATMVSYSALSRGVTPAGDFDLVVLDEAHHARNPATRRYAALAKIAVRSRVLLLTATPVHNRRADVAALLALFLGARAHSMADREIARLIVRRERAEVAEAVSIPEAAAPAWIHVSDDALLLDEILALPPPIPPANAGDGGVLLTWSLLRQWASSRGALAGALRRRIARGIALESALEVGRHPDRRELRAWSVADDAVQLAFPQLMASPAAEPHALLPLVRAHLTAIRALLARVRSTSMVDASRARSLRELCARHAGEKVIAFSQYADTVHALFAELGDMRAVAALTARGARVASGRLSRQEALERFTPRAMSAPPPRDIERIDLLLTTDLASEGLNLHDASVVVHLDLPWTPARLEQRVARSRRLGALHARTVSYALAPPADAERVLSVERRLRAKLRTMEGVIGSAGSLLPELTEGEKAEAHQRTSDARVGECVHRAIERWRVWDATAGDAGKPPDASELCETRVACVASDRMAVLVLAVDAGRAVLAAALDDAELSQNSSVVLAAIELLGGVDAVLDERMRRSAIARAERWAARTAGARAGGALAWRGTSRRIALRRIAGLATHAPLHRRALIAPLAVVARRVVTAPYALGAERVLDELASAPLPDEAWLRALASFGAMHGAEEREAREEVRLVAVMIGG